MFWPVLIKYSQNTNWLTTASLQEEVTLYLTTSKKLVNPIGFSTCRQVSVLLDVKEAGEITLEVSYLVTAAKWVPKYDIRAFSDDSVVKVIFSRRTNEWFESIWFAHRSWIVCRCGLDLAKQLQDFTGDIISRAQTFVRSFSTLCYQHHTNIWALGLRFISPQKRCAVY